MRIIFFINILLIASCISARKEVNNTSPARNIASLKNREKEFDMWYKKGCVANPAQAKKLVEMQLPNVQIQTYSAPKKWREMDGSISTVINLKGNINPSGLLGNIVAATYGNTILTERMYNIRLCKKPMSTIDFKNWLDKAKVCSLSHAKFLLSLKNPSIKVITIKQDSNFYHLNTPSGNYKIGMDIDCLIQKSGSYYPDHS